MQVNIFLTYFSKEANSPAVGNIIIIIIIDYYYYIISKMLLTIICNFGIIRCFKAW
jgi:hypothetical protein